MMLQNGTLQYYSDTRLLEKIFTLDAGLRVLHAPLNKEAGVTDFLGGLASQVAAWGKEHVDTQNGAGGILSSLADLLIPGMLFKAHPALGVLSTIAEVMGFSPMGIIRNIMKLIKGKLSSGSLPTMEDINSVGKQSVAAEAGPIEESEEANEVTAGFFDFLHQMEKRGQLLGFVRQAQRRRSSGLFGGTSELPEIPFLGNSNAGIIERIFGQLFQTRSTGKAKWLLGGFIVWIIKTILLGAGLVAGAEAIKHLVSGPKKPEIQEAKPESTSNEHAVYQESVRPSGAAQQTESLTPTGRGQDHHVNDHVQSTWIVPLIGGSVRETLLAWAADVYKELAGKAEQLSGKESFNKTVDIMQAGVSSDHKLTVPAQFKSRKEVVDTFAKN